MNIMNHYTKNFMKKYLKNILGDKMNELKLRANNLNELYNIILKFLNPVKLLQFSEPIKIKLKDDAVIEASSEKEKILIELSENICPSCTLFYLQEVITQYLTKLLDKEKIKVKIEENNSYIFFENKKIYEDDINEFYFIIYPNNIRR